MVNFIQPFTINIRDEEIIIQDFLVILKHSLQNYLKILRIFLVSTTLPVMLLSGWNLQPHTDISPLKRRLHVKVIPIALIISLNRKAYKCSFFRNVVNYNASFDHQIDLQNPSILPRLYQS